MKLFYHSSAFKVASSLILLTAVIHAGTVTAPYTNDFTSSAADFTTSGSGSWSLVDTNSDTNSDAYQFTTSDTSSTGFSMLTIAGSPGANFNDFSVSTTFTVTDAPGSGQTYWGMAVLGDSETPSDYILVDYRSDSGNFRIINVGGDGTGTAVNESAFGGSFELDKAYTLTVTGSYVGSMLTLTADFDDGSPVQSITASAFDASANYTGSAMGLRVRSGSGGGTTVDYDSFAVTAIPEPGAYAFLGGICMLSLVILRRR